MKILAVSLGVPGHLTPILAAATMLSSHHDVCVLACGELGAMVHASGLAFIPEPAESSTFVGRFINSQPYFLQLEPGIEQLRFGLRNYIAANIPVQAANIARVLETFPADVILADSFFFGTLPMLLGPRDKRPAIAHLGISVLNVHSGEGIPPLSEISAAQQTADRICYQRDLLDPVQMAFNQALAEYDVEALDVPAMQSLSILSDLYIHPGVGSFEYPHTSSNVHFIGRLPMAAAEVPLPDWWNDLDHTKHIVLVTQGTIANRDFNQLIGPTLMGLANESDVIVLVTTGGQPLDSIPVALPANARAAEFLPFEAIFPYIDLLVTNGGYGTVNLALAHGIPIVAAGLSEDKGEVSAHVQWAGVGIDMRTTFARAEDIRRDVRAVLDTPDYRTRAQEIAKDFAARDAKASLLDLIAQFDLKQNML